MEGAKTVVGGWAMNLVRRMAVLLALLAPLLACVEARAQLSTRTQCDFYKSTSCAVTGCYDTTIKAWSFIDWSTNEYEMCDTSGCRNFEFEPFEDGIYVSLSFPKHDLMFKLNLSDSSAVETGTMLNTSTVAFGNCTKVEKP